MYYIIANKILKYFIDKGYVDGNSMKNWQLIIEYTLSLLVNVLVASGIGHTLDMEREMIVFSIFYTVLRVSNGGNYLKVNVKNTVSLWGFGAAILFCTEYMISESYGSYVLLLFLAISLGLVISVIPLEMRRSNLPEEVKHNLSRRSIITISIECVCLLAGICVFHNTLIAAAVAGVFIQSVSLVMISPRSRQIIDFSQYAVN